MGLLTSSQTSIAAVLCSKCAVKDAFKQHTSRYTTSRNMGIYEIGLIDSFT